MYWQVTLGAVMSDRDVPEPRFNGHPLYGPKIPAKQPEPIPKGSSLLEGIAGIFALGLFLVCIAWFCGFWK